MMILNEEIRGMIFNLFPQNETLNLRLVCKTWNQDIQNYYEYEIKKLDEDSPNFNSILQLRITELEIHKLETTSVFNYNGQLIFKHPNAVRQLVIPNKAIVAQLNLQLLIGLFSENLEVLDIHVSAKICNYRCPSDLFYNFKHLKNFIIRITKQSDKCEDNPMSLFQVFENSSFPKLQVFEVYLEHLKMTREAKGRIVGNLLRIISKHGKLLQYLLLMVNPKFKLTELPAPLQEDELARIKEIDTLKFLILHVDPVGLASKQFWTEFLLNQKKLMAVYLNYCSPFHPIPVPMLEEILLKNSSTLEILYLELKFSPTDQPFDLAFFKNNINLERLSLCQRTSTRASSDQPDVTNFHCLPENIRRLSFTTLRILSVDILTAFQYNKITTPEKNTKGFKKLKALDLVDCGNGGRFGVNGVVLYEIMMGDRPRLTRVDFSGEVHQTEFSFKTVLNQLNIAEDADLRLKRNASGWVSY